MGRTFLYKRAFLLFLSADCLGEERGVYYAHKRATKRHHGATIDVDSNSTVIGDHFAWVMGGGG